MSEYKFPTEEVVLSFKGLFYAKDNPLSIGIVVINFMTVLSLYVINAILNFY